MGRTFPPQDSFRITIGMFVIGSIISPRIFISTSTNDPPKLVCLLQNIFFHPRIARPDEPFERAKRPLNYRRRTSSMADSNSPPLDPVQQILQIAGGYIVSSALYVITAAGVADQLEKGPRTAAIWQKPPI